MSNLISSGESEFREIILLVVLLAVGAVAFYPMFAMKYKGYEFRAEPGRYLGSYTQITESRSPELNFRRGALAFENHQYDEAIDLLNQAIAQDGMFIPALAVRAQAFCRTQNYRAAIIDLSRIIGLDPTNRPVMLLRASLYYRLGQRSEAARDMYDIGIPEKEIDKMFAQLPDPANAKIYK